MRHSVVICDHCGKKMEDALLFIDFYPMQISLFSKISSASPTIGEKLFDLCADCKDALLKWISKKDEGGWEL